MAGGGIGIEYSFRALPKMLPGLILCMVFGWAALQWDVTTSGWSVGYAESTKLLKAAEKEGGVLAPFADYTAKSKAAFAAKEADYQLKLQEHKATVAGLPAGQAKPKEPKKPSRPRLLNEADYNELAQARDMPAKFSFGNKIVQFQLTYVAVLLLVGMLIRNTLDIPQVFKAGTIAARPIIKPGIVILGAYYLWSDLLKVGAIGLALVVTFVLGTQILISHWARRSKVDEGLAGVMAAGVGVCGVSAAVAVAPVMNAKPRDFFYAIGTILLFGTLALFTFPYIGQALDMSQPVFGAWAGTAILNTAQLVAAASWYGHEALLTANVINIVRVGFIPLIVLWTIYFYVVQPAIAAGGEAQKVNVWQVIKEKFPIFILGFFVIVTMNEYGMFAQSERDILGKELLKLFFAIGFAGVGLNIAFDDLKKAGGTAFVIGVIAATLKAVLSAVAVMAIGAEVFAIH